MVNFLVTLLVFVSVLILILLYCNIYELRLEKHKRKFTLSSPMNASQISVMGVEELNMVFEIVRMRVLLHKIVHMGIG